MSELQSRGPGPVLGNTPGIASDDPSVAALDPRLQLALAAGRLGLWEWSIGAGSVHWTSELERMHGIPIGSFPGTFDAYQRDIHPEDRERVLDTIRRTVEDRREHHLEYRIVRPDGQVRWLEAHGRLVLDRRGQPERLVGVCGDVTERKEMERRLRFLAAASSVLASSLDYERTLRSVADLAIEALADWCAVDLAAGRGHQTLALAHRDPSRVALAQELRRRYPPDPQDPAGVPNVMRTGQSELVPDIPDELLTRIAKDDDHLALLRSLGLRSYMVVPMKVQDRLLGTITFVASESNRRYGPADLELAEELASRAAAAVENARLFYEVHQQREELEMQAEEMQNITEELEVSVEEQRVANDELARRTDEAERARRDADVANRAKADFLAMMSHELRTPLNAIAGYAELMELEIQGPLTPQQRESLQRIRRSQTHLLSLINDVLNFVKLEAGQVSLDIADVRLDETLASVEEMIRPRVAARSLRLAVHGDAGVSVRADRDKLQQIVLNLLTNATKFTPEGGAIDLTWTARADVVSIVVRDTGIGIPAHHLESIFEPFVQVGRHRQPNEGVGLGLAISRDLARAMGGELTVTSEVGAGSAFTLTMPGVRT